MSVETEAETDLTEDVDELAAELGEAITDLPVYREYLEAKETVESDEDLQKEIQAFERLREEFMMARQAGDATNDDLRELQQTQQELHEKPKMEAFLQAQSELELRLQELNELVSEPLAVDFGQTAGGCCED
ncbi:YlbF family regulator [Natronomonas marina]|jgi:cell fate (sporulation/competence/biofilm development) regulator YlbF (YheA/YmcA/DUF963 family)|uniref:YlbF family regulator n=1 Tax=Natronomonas marina TaxID=2961939 RepID=UPI0020C99EA0|nr:YlbF family regulator [Natronomonas marina]